jgi:hypothetical protein
MMFLHHQPESATEPLPQCEFCGEVDCYDGICRIVQLNGNKASGVEINGIFDSSIYVGEPTFVGAPSRGNPQPDGAATANVWMAWDENALYVYAIVDDTTPNHGDGDWGFDNLEIFIDWNAGRGTNASITDATPYWQVRVSPTAGRPNNAIVSGTIYNSPGVSFASHVTAIAVPIDGDWNNGYIVEARIEAPSSVALYSGKQIPVDFQVGDNMLGTGRSGQKFLVSDPSNDTHWPCMGLLLLGPEYEGDNCTCNICSVCEGCIIEKTGTCDCEDCPGACTCVPPSITLSKATAEATTFSWVSTYTNATLYVVQRQTLAEGLWGPWSNVKQVSPTATPFTYDAVAENTPNGTYNYRIVAMTPGLNVVSTNAVQIVISPLLGPDTFELFEVGDPVTGFSWLDKNADGRGDVVCDTESDIDRNDVGSMG